MTHSFTDLVSRARRDAEAFRDIPRQELVAAAREFVASSRAATRARHDAGASGGQVMEMLTEAADETIRGVLDFGLARAVGTRAPMARLSVCALGGYGRGELNPHSDLDVCLLHDGPMDEALESLSGFLVPFLWDIGFEIGYAIRGVDETTELARTDVRAFTSLLESRLIAGDHSTFARLKLLVRDLQAGYISSAFIEERVRERQAGLRPPHDNLFAPEPDIKEGAGGLRDYHTAMWLLMVMYGTFSLDDIPGLGLMREDEHLDLVEGLDFMWRVRNELHFHCGRDMDALTFANQRHVARAFDYGDDEARGLTRFMEDYYAAARRLRAFLLDMARVYDFRTTGRETTSMPSRSDFEVRNGELLAGANDPNWYAERPVRLVEVFWAAARHGVPVSRATARAVTANLHLVNDELRTSDIARRFLLATCNQPLRAGAAFRQMAETGFLPAFIPEFGNVQGVIRYEDFHHYPVDEHTLVAMEALARIPRMDGPVAAILQEALEHLLDPHILLLAILLHDLGKASGEEHVEASDAIAEQVCRRMGMPEEDEERIRFLVRHHLLMTDISQYRDLDQEETVRVFADTVRTEQRLRALFLLSYADLSAVGPSVWTDWKGALLMKLYLKTERVLQGRGQGSEAEEWLARKSSEVAALVPEEVKPLVYNHLHDLGQRYLAAFRSSAVAQHLACLVEAQRTGLALKTRTNEETGVSEVVVCTVDRPGLFSMIAGSFASQLVDVASAALFTRGDGYVVDCFSVTEAHGGGPLTERQAEEVERVLRRVLFEGHDIQEWVDQSRRRLFALLQPRVPVPTQVDFDNESSSNYTVVDIRTGDRTGLLYDITRAMTELGLDIATARVVTDARRVRDSFYVTLNGKKIEEDMQAGIGKALHEAIHPRSALQTEGGRQ